MSPSRWWWSASPPVSLVVASFLAKRSYKYFQGQSTVRGEQTALVNEMIEGQKVVQAFGHEAQSLEAFDEVNGRLQGREPEGRSSFPA